MRKKKTILVVDSDPSFREAVANLLLLRGVDRYDLAENAEQAMSIAASADFDLVLIASFPEEGSGTRLARELQKELPNATFVIVIEDSHPPVRNGGDRTEGEFPIIHKSFLSHTLPQLLADTAG